MIACTDKSFFQISMKSPVENVFQAEFWNEAKSLKSHSADLKLDSIESYGRERPSGKILDGNDTFYLYQLSEVISLSVIFFWF